MTATVPGAGAPARGWRPRRVDLARFAWYPAEVGAIYVLAVFLASGVSPFAMFRSLAVTVGIALLITLVATVLLLDAGRGGMLAFLVVVAILGPDTTVMLGLLLVAGCLAIAFDRLPRRTLTWGRVSGWLTTFTTILLVIVLAQGILGGRLTEAWGGGSTPAAAGDAGATGMRTGAPDIYVIVLDAYARPDMLLSEFGLDVSPFVDALRARGFDVATQSRSDYDRTDETLVSMLDMAPVDTVPGVGSAGPDTAETQQTLRLAINANVVFRRYRALGYTVVATGSGFEEVAIRGADVYLDDGQLNSFEWRLLADTGAGRLLDAIAPSFVGDELRSRLASAFSQLRSVAATSQRTPRLVIGHILSPHPPAVFGPNGEPRPVVLDRLYNSSGEDADGETQRQAYADQVTYLNRRLTETVDAILAAAKAPPVIILMSDHGSRIGAASGDPGDSDESHDTLFAALTPGFPKLYGDSPTPLIVFERLLSAYGGARSIP